MGRPSSIETLPPDMKEKLRDLLRDPRVSQLEVTEEINRLLEEEGRAERISKSAVNRYNVRMEKVGAKLRQSREIAEMWIGRLGSEPQGKVGHLLNEVVRGLAFDCATKLAEGEEPPEPREIRELSQAVERLEKAADSATKREEEIRERERKRQAEKLAEMEKTGKGKGLDPETLRVIREEIYGIPSGSA